MQKIFDILQKILDTLQKVTDDTTETLRKVFVEVDILRLELFDQCIADTFGSKVSTAFSTVAANNNLDLDGNYAGERLAELVDFRPRAVGLLVVWGRIAPDIVR
jgi:hypothetical protein